uniref:POU-specific domain-containing protein n=1 Tax=Ascaris lumbricoides TaxID=6252 RepID=A0A9J2P626_ASCLU
MVASFDDVEDWRELPMREVLRRLGRQPGSESSENDVSNGKKIPVSIHLPGHCSDESNDRAPEEKLLNKSEIEGESQGEEANEDLADPSVERRIPEVMHEMYDFMRRFKAFRTEAGLTRNDTVLALNRRYGLRLSKDALSSFEQYLDPAGVRKWFRYLNEWMSDAQAILANGVSVDVVLRLPPKEPNVLGLSEANKRYNEAKARKQKKRAKRQDRGNLVQPTDGNTESLEIDELLELFGEKQAEKPNNKATSKGRRKPKHILPSKESENASARDEEVNGRGASDDEPAKIMEQKVGHSGPAGTRPDVFFPKTETIMLHVEETEHGTVVSGSNVESDNAQKVDACVQNTAANTMKKAKQTTSKVAAKGGQTQAVSTGSSSVSCAERSGQKTVKSAISKHDSCQSLGWKVRLTDGKTVDVRNRKLDDSLVTVNVFRLFAHLWEDFQKFGPSAFSAFLKIFS